MKELALFVLSLSTYGYAVASSQLTDERVRALAVADVLTARCQSIYPSTATYVEYRKAASKLLSVADLNSDLYSDVYRKVTQVVNSKTHSQMNSDCEEYIPKIAAMIPEMRKDYDAYVYLADADKRREANAWAEAIEAFAAAANQIGRTAQSYNYSFIPIPSGRVTFSANSISGGAYNHYLVNTPSGTKQCRASGSGYIFCN
jgi:hypothetical protein